MSEDVEVVMVCEGEPCYGIVKEYSESGPRDPPEWMDDGYDNIIVKIIASILSMLGIRDDETTWWECSVCGRVHDW